MKSLKKVLMMVLVGAFAFMPMVSVNAMEKFTFEDWNTVNGDYGTATKVDDNVTHLEGKYYEDKGMAYAAFTKKVQTALADGVTEEVNVELNKDTIADHELFELSMAFNNAECNNVDEVIVMTQRVGDKYVLTSGKAPEFKAEVTEDGVYTYRYNATIEDGKTYWQFTLLKDGNEVATTGKVDLGETTFETVRYIWFCNVKVAKGINVYTNVPEVEEPTTTPEEPTTTPPEQEREEDTTENPETSDGIILFLGLAVIGLAGTSLAYRRLHN